MAVSVIPALVDALVTAARAALPTVQVFDGFGVTDNPGDFLMVGVDDPDSPRPANAATSQQTPATLGTTRSRDEDGTITCAALSWNGNADQKAARDAAFATVAAVENLIRAVTFPPLGVAGVRQLGHGPTLDLTQDQNDSGAMALVIFAVQFKARI